MQESAKLPLKSQKRKVRKFPEPTNEAAPASTEPLVEEVKEEISYGPIGNILMDCLLKMLITPGISLVTEPEFKSDTNGTTRR